MPKAHGHAFTSTRDVQATYAAQTIKLAHCTDAIKLILDIIVRYLAC